MAIFCNFCTTKKHLHPLQVENCDSNSRLVVDEDDNGKFRLERVEPSRCIKTSFYVSEKRFNFPIVFLKLVYQFIAIFINFSPTSSDLHQLQVENCDSNSRLVVDEDAYGKLRLERVKIKTKWRY